jgi:hypothetical protein
MPPKKVEKKCLKFLRDSGMRPTIFHETSKNAGGLSGFAQKNGKSLRKPTDFPDLRRFEKSDCANQERGTKRPPHLCITGSASEGPNVSR